MPHFYLHQEKQEVIATFEVDLEHSTQTAFILCALSINVFLVLVK